MTTMNVTCDGEKRTLTHAEIAAMAKKAAKDAWQKYGERCLGNVTQLGFYFQIDYAVDDFELVWRYWGLIYDREYERLAKYNPGTVVAWSPRGTCCVKHATGNPAGGCRGEVPLWNHRDFTFVKYEYAV